MWVKRALLCLRRPLVVACPELRHAPRRGCYVCEYVCEYTYAHIWACNIGTRVAVGTGSTPPSVPHPVSVGSTLSLLFNPFAVALCWASFAPMEVLIFEIPRRDGETGSQRSPTGLPMRNCAIICKIGSQHSVRKHLHFFLIFYSNRFDGSFRYVYKD